MNSLTFSPSLLSADFSKLREDLLSTEAAFETARAQFKDSAFSLSHHLDIMDGHFVPNLTFGPEVLKWIRGATSQPFDAHLMVTDPDSWIEAFASIPVQNITVHLEAAKHLDRTLQKIRSLGCTAGVSLNPATPLSALDPELMQHDLFDRVLLMSVNPGFGGQKFIPYPLEKARQLRNLYPHLTLQMDGGIGKTNFKEVIDSGVNDVVMGSAIYGSRERPLSNQDRTATFAACMSLYQGRN